MKMTLHPLYRNRHGHVIPGVTAVIDQLGWSKEGLLRWATNLAAQGLDPDKVRDHAADVGSLAHHFIHCHLAGRPAVTATSTPVVVEKAWSCFQGFLNWQAAHQLELLGTELEVVSEEYQYGGTLDLVARVDGVLSIVDFKTGSGVYPEHRIQLAAYGQAWTEMHPDQPIQGFHLLHLDREKYGFRHHWYPELEHAFAIFRHLRAIYDLRTAV
jgi:hypothetical protein